MNYEAWVKQGLEAFGVTYTLKDRKKHPLGESLKVKIQGPLYKGNERTLCSITLELSLREGAQTLPQVRTIAHQMDVIPAFDVYVMDEREIMAEKTHAVLARHSARDLYDLRFLIEKGVKVQREDIEKKLAARGMEYDFRQFEKRCRELKTIWPSELKALVRNVQAYDEALQEVLEYYMRL